MPSALPADAFTGLMSWCEISRQALHHNVGTVRAALQGTTAKLGVVVKADAYGHGIAPVAQTLVEAGVDWLIVNFAHEATSVRAAGLPNVPLYVCGTFYPTQAPAVAQARARVVVYDAAQLVALDAASRALGVVTPVHLKIETGTHRQGLRVDEALQLAARLADLPGLALEGLTTHFADIEDTTDHRFALSQRKGLEEAKAAFLQAGFAPTVVHAANSAATLLEPGTQQDLVRVGIAAYGLWPSKETLSMWRQKRGVDVDALDDDSAPELQPVLSWRARLAQVKEVKAGGYVGYGRTWRATRDSLIAIVPVGYHEGYDRGLSNVGHVLVNGARAPVRGRVCMNMCMVDVTDVPECRAGDIATLIGSDGAERVSADQVAAWLGTIHYEVVARLHPGQPRLLTP